VIVSDSSSVAKVALAASPAITIENSPLGI